MIDLVLPVYNEAHVLDNSVRALIAASEDWNFSWRILIVDNASIDGTDEVGRRLEREFDSVAFVRLPIKGRDTRFEWPGLRPTPSFRCTWISTCRPTSPRSHSR